MEAKKIRQLETKREALLNRAHLRVWAWYYRELDQIQAECKHENLDISGEFSRCPDCGLRGEL